MSKEILRKLDMNLIDKYLGEATMVPPGLSTKYTSYKEKFPSGRKQYTPGDIIRIIKANKKYQGKQGKVITNLSYPNKKEYHIEVDVDGKKVVLKNTEVELVKAMRI